MNEIKGRRKFIKAAGAFAAVSALPIMGCGGGSDASTNSGASTSAAQRIASKMLMSSNTVVYLAPQEGGDHVATWMAYGATASAWGVANNDVSNSRDIAREDLMRIAANLSRFGTVNMLVASDTDQADANTKLDAIFTQNPVSPKNQIVKITDLANTTFGSNGNIHVYEPSGKTLPPMSRGNINLIVQPINDLWTRDTAPVFVKDASGAVYGVNFNFNGWGQEPISTGLIGWEKDAAKAANGVQDQDVSADKTVASFIDVRLGVTELSTWVTMEGGSIEVNGRGLAVASESSIINNNRNPGKSKADFEAEFNRLFGVEKVIWIPGIKATEITDGHVDFYARFSDQSTILYTWDGGVNADGVTPTTDQANLAALSAFQTQVTNWSVADKLKYLGGEAAFLKLVSLPTPNSTMVQAAVQARNPEVSMTSRSNFEATFAAGYVGCYETNNCVLMGQFGDPDSDKSAFNLIQQNYPDRIVIQITTDGIGNAGGTIHCATQQQIA